MSSDFADRLRKNARHLGRWAARGGLTAWRVYDRDIPEYPFVVERYGPAVHLVEYPRRAQRAAGGHPEREAVVAAVVGVLRGGPGPRLTKPHAPQPWGRPRYGRLSAAGAEFQVEEGPMRFIVNLSDRLDTGLFLDHRNTRARVRAESAGKRVLNLFAYTGSFTVAAATGGGTGAPRLRPPRAVPAPARRHLALHRGGGAGHELVRADCLQWLDEARGQWDVVVLDPPPHSTSKGMRGDFNVQRDHRRLLERALALLAAGGVLYFSTNYKGFRLEPEGLP